MLDLPSLPVSEDTEDLCSGARTGARALDVPQGGQIPEFSHRFAEASRLGITGLTVPETLGGAGLNATSATSVIEALSEEVSDAGFVFSLAAHLFACIPPINAIATQEQRQRWLPRLAGGAVGAFAVTEAEAGSDAMAINTRATQSADGDWRLSGTKTMITNAPDADLAVILARTEPGRSYFGLTAFVVDTTTSGITAGPAPDKLVLPTAPLGELILDDCVVPDRDRLGPVGGGAAVLATAMSWERVCLFGLYTGQMRRALNRTAEYLAGRKQFGAPLIELPTVAHDLADAATRAEAARSLLMRAAGALDHNTADATVLGDMAKVVVSETAVQVALRCIQLQGANGVTGPALDLLLEALPARIFSGSNEVQLASIARAVNVA